MVIAEKIVISNASDLHLRSAAKLVLLVNRYKCEVTVCNGSKCVNAKSIIGLVGFGATDGMEVKFIFRGDDAEEASRDVRLFFQQSSEE